MPAPKILTTLLHEEEKRFASEADLKAYLTEQRQLYDALPEDDGPGATVDFPNGTRQARLHHLASGGAGALGRTRHANLPR